MNAGNFSRRQMLKFAAVTGAAAMFVKPASAQAPTRKIDSMDSALDAIISTSEPIRILGEGYGGDGGPALNSTWNGPKGIVYAPDHSLYISDTENHVIRRVSLTDGTVSTVVGTGTRGDGPEGDPRACALARPHGVCIHDGTLYIGDSENYRIRALRL